jgi:hypothetical protein
MIPLLIQVIGCLNDFKLRVYFPSRRWFNFFRPHIPGKCKLAADRVMIRWVLTSHIVIHDFTQEGGKGAAPEQDPVDMQILVMPIPTQKKCPE